MQFWTTNGLKFKPLVEQKYTKSPSIADSMSWILKQDLKLKHSIYFIHTARLIVKAFWNYVGESKIICSGKGVY